MGKMEHPYHLDEIYAGYTMMRAAYALYSTTRSQDPADVESYFIVPTTSIIDTDQKPEERKWEARKNLLETYSNICTSLRQLFKKDINPAYHSWRMANKGMVWRGFDNDEPPVILQRLKRLYGMPSVQYLYQAHPSPPRPNRLQPTSRGDAPHHWGGPNVLHSKSR